MKYPDEVVGGFVEALKENERGIPVADLVHAGQEVALEATAVAFDDPELRTGALHLWDLLGQAEERL